MKLGYATLGRCYGNSDSKREIPGSQKPRISVMAKAAAIIFAVALPLVSSCGGSGRGPADGGLADHPTVADHPIEDGRGANDNQPPFRDGAVADNRSNIQDSRIQDSRLDINRDSTIVDWSGWDGAVAEDRHCVSGGLVTRDETHDMPTRGRQRFWIEPGTSIARVEIDLIDTRVAPYNFVRVRSRGYTEEGRQIYADKTITLDRNPATTPFDSFFVAIGEPTPGDSIRSRLNQAHVILNSTSGIEPCFDRCNANISVVREFQETCD